MITKLTPEQASIHWDEIKEHLRISLPPMVGTDDQALINILEAHVASTACTWALTEQVKGRTKLHGLITTVYTIDFASGTKNLLIYGLTGYKFISEDLRKEAIETMHQFAVENKCKYILAYSSVPRVIQVAKSLGANIDTTFIQWEV